MCNHKDKIFVSGTEVCIDCGHSSEDISGEQEFLRNSQNANKQISCQSKIQKTKSIAKELQGLKMSDKIINFANEMFVEIVGNNIKRKTSR